MAASMKHKLIKTALVSRVLVILLQIVLNNLVPDHNADAFHYQQSQQPSLADNVVKFLLGGFGKWDGAHFLSIAEKGYVEERQYAFFPLLPTMMSALANLIFLPMRHILSLYSCLLIVATIINLISFTLAACAIYKLGEHVLNDRRMAYNAALLFCINPATVFFSSIYTESLFAALTFYGMLFIEQGSYAISAIAFALSTLTRSNGLVSCGFVLYKLSKETISYLITRRDPINLKLIFICCANLVTIFMSILLVIFPFVAYQFYGYVNLCTDYETMFAYLSDYISGKTLHVTKTGSPWCYNKPPLLYSYIQDHYWDVGFLKYYQMKKSPNFILALPMIAICTCAIWNYFCENWNSVKYLGLKKASSVTTGYLSEGVFVYVVHLMTLLAFATTCINVEVVTRLIASYCPVFYWYVASIIKTRGYLKRKQLKSTDQDYESIFSFCNYFDREDLKTKMIFIYFLSYFVVGILLHCNFLPWT